LEAAGNAQRPLTISQANTLMAHALAAALPAVFFVEGEISNFRTYDRGHAFFTLKDVGAELPCIMWKDALGRLKFRPENGQAVIARGAVKMYEPQGRIQLYVETMWPVGAGALEAAFRALCEKLRKEGLFDAARKRKLPRVPRHIAVITSRTGDVLHDVLTTAWRRYPGLCVSLVPVRVQGAQAAGDMVRAIELVNRYNEENVKLKTQNAKLGFEEAEAATSIDLILLVRGGGSLEDLWAFNEEILARAIVASRLPIATGIGHEPDTTIADLVGDLRGPTPTGVTELTIPDARALSAELGNRAALLTRDVRRTVTLWRTNVERSAVALTAAVREAMRQRRETVEGCARQVAAIEPRHAVAQGWRRVEEAQRRLWLAMRDRVRGGGGEAALVALSHRLERVSPLGRIGRLRDRLGHLELRLAQALRTRVTTARERLAAEEMQLQAVSPQAVLERGYSITTDKDGTVIRKAQQVKKGDIITTRLADGEITSTVGKPKQGSLF
jgi:exodeoxyribonuclease VII large subunit